MTSPSPACLYCGLPQLPGEGGYCCFGCRLAHAIEREQGSVPAGETSHTMLRLGLAVFLSMNVMMATMLLWSEPAGPISPTAAALYGLFRHLALVLSAPVLLLLGGPLASEAWRELRQGRLSASLLLVLGVAAAFATSATAVVAGGPVYFEVACMVLVFVTLGRFFEARGKAQTTATLRTLERLLPDRVLRVEAGLEGERQVEVPLGEIARGDIVLARPGERFAVDGLVRRNSAAVDEQAVTGESVPVVKEPGDTVYGGTLNLDGPLWIEATAPAHSGAIAQLLESVLEAARNKDRYQILANTLAAWFLPLVLAVASVALAVHWAKSDLSTALLVALAVVVISCPCALGLATPMAVWAAFGRASRAGVLVRNGEMFQRLAGVRAVCFDKTGTLSTGVAEVVQVITDGETPVAEVVGVASSLAQGSPHVLAQAVATWANSDTGTADPKLCQQASQLQTLPGRGVTGRVGHSPHPAWLGSERLMREQGQALASVESGPWQQALVGEQPLTFVAWAGKVRGAFVFREQLRPQAAPAIDSLKRLGLAVYVLTGDRAERAEALKRELSLEVAANLLPQAKLQYVAQLRQRHGPIAMIGDGLNDAPALAAADVGMALGCGADLSRYTAGICLLGNDLGKVATTLQLARELQRTIRWNLAWAFGYNLIGLGVAAAGWLHPVVAALAMVISSLLVVSNSLRLGNEREAAQLADKRAPSETPDGTTNPEVGTPPAPLPLAEELAHA